MLVPSHSDMMAYVVRLMTKGDHHQERLGRSQDAAKPQGEDGLEPKPSHTSSCLPARERGGGRGEGASWPAPAGLGTALGGNSILLHQRAPLLIKSLDQTLCLLDPFLHPLTQTASPPGLGINHRGQTSVGASSAFL